MEKRTYLSNSRVSRFNYYRTQGKETDYIYVFHVHYTENLAKTKRSYTVNVFLDKIGYGKNYWKTHDHAQFCVAQWIVKGILDKDGLIIDNNVPGTKRSATVLKLVPKDDK